MSSAPGALFATSGASRHIVRSLRGALVGLLPTIGFYVAYRLGGNGWAVPIGVALTAAVFPLERKITGRARFAWIGLGTVVLGAALALATRNPKLFFLRAVLGDVGWGVVMLGSLVVGRPILGTFARWVVPIPDAYVQTPAYRRSFGLVTFVWGSVTLARAGIRGYLVAKGSMDRFVAVQMLSGPPVFGVLLAFAVWYPRRVARRFLASLGAPPEVVDRVMRGEVEEPGK